MIPPRIPAILTASVALVLVAGATPPSRDRISGAELAARHAAVGSPLSRLAANATVKAPTARPELRSILAHSEILSDGERWTVVPEGAVLHQPAELASRVGGDPAGTFVPWIDFLSRNRAWVTTREVSLPEAKGERPFPERETEAWQKYQRLVVAVHLGGPISVLPSQPQTASQP